MGYGWLYLGDAELPAHALDAWVARTADSSVVCASLDGDVCRHFALQGDQPDEATVRGVLDALAEEPGAVVTPGPQVRIGAWVSKGSDGWGLRDALVAAFVLLGEHGGRGALVVVGDEVGPEAGFRLEVDGAAARLIGLDAAQVRAIRASRPFREVIARVSEAMVGPPRARPPAPPPTPAPGSYLDHAMKTVAARAFCDARDGLKRIERHVLWTLHVEGPLEPAALGARATARFGAPPTAAQAVSWMVERRAGPLALVALEGRRATLTPLSAEALSALAQDEPAAFDDGRGPEGRLLSLPVPWLLAAGARGTAIGAACRVDPVAPAELLESARDRLASPRRAPARQLVDGPQPVLDDGGLAHLDGVALLDAWIAHRRATLARLGEGDPTARIERELRALLGPK